MAQSAKTVKTCPGNVASLAKPLHEHFEVG
jgi:hypothetical protein